VKFKMKVEREFDIKTLQVDAGVRHWEDGSVDGDEDINGEIPCKNGDCWCPRIDIETGQVLNWHYGIYAEVHYKVCDNGSYALFDKDGISVLDLQEEYVPDCLAIDDNGYGDYIIMTINEDGFIKDWNFTLAGFGTEECDD